MASWAVFLCFMKICSFTAMITLSFGKVFEYLIPRKYYLDELASLAGMDMSGHILELENTLDGPSI